MPFDPNNPLNETDQANNEAQGQTFINNLLAQWTNLPDVQAWLQAHPNGIQSPQDRASLGAIQAKYPNLVPTGYDVQDDGSLGPSTQGASFLEQLLIGAGYMVATSAGLSALGGLVGGAAPAAPAMSGGADLAANLGPSSALVWPGDAAAAAAAAPAAAGVSGAGAATAATTGYVGADVAGTEAGALGAGGTLASTPWTAPGFMAPGGASSLMTAGGSPAALVPPAAGKGFDWQTAAKYGLPVIGTAITDALNQSNLDKQLAQQKELADRATALQQSTLDPFRGQMSQVKDLTAVEHQLAGPRSYTPAPGSPYAGAVNPANAAPGLSATYLAALKKAQDRIATGDGQNGNVLDPTQWGQNGVTNLLN